MADDWPRCDAHNIKTDAPCVTDASFTVGSIYTCAIHLAPVVREHHRTLGSPMIVRCLEVSRG